MTNEELFKAVEKITRILQKMADDLELLHYRVTQLERRK